jgi:TRAP-type C4-dicarboxylate transport system permease small subunit
VKIQPLLDRLGRAGAAVETVMLASILAVMMLVVVGQVIMRELFGTGFGWVDELVRLMVLWLALVGSIAACRENRHIRIDALSNILPKSAVRLIRLFVDIFAAVVCAVIAVHAWRYLQIEIEYGDTVLVDSPAWIAHSIMPIAFLLISYRFLIDVLKQAIAMLFGRAAE